MCDCQDQITLPVGQDGASAYVYIGYASDNTGTGFSTTPSNSLDYISVKSSATPQTNNSTLHTSNWAKYQGDDGTNGVDYAPILYNSFDAASTSNGAYTLLDNYELPADTLADNGDVIDVVAYVESTSLTTTGVEQQKEFEFRVAGSHFTAKLASYLMDINDKIITFRFKISRVSSTSVRILAETTACNSNYFGTHTTTLFDDVTVLNLTTNTLMLALYGKNTAAIPAETIEVKQFLVQKSKIV